MEILPPTDLLAALDAIFGAERSANLLGDDFSGLTMAMSAAAVRCFRQQRDDEHAAVLRAAFDAVDRGTLYQCKK